VAVTPGTVVEGTVVGITNFGAFVQIEGSGTGLVHISEIANEYVRDVNNHVKMNDKVKVKVLNVDSTNGKMDLSLKQAVVPEGADPVFEEKLSKFLKTSEERLLDIKRNIEAKRGGRFK
jgi:S1 RNA binding domain protein